MNRSRSTLIADAWQRFDRALATSEPLVADSAPAVPELIAAHAASADQAATFSGNLHRGTQAAFLLAAVASVLLGTLPALFMDVPKVSHSIKHWSVPAEAILLTVVLGVWGLDYFTTSHNRWSDCRRLAERLRCLRATWPLGFDVADRRSDHAQTWTEWQARAIRRAIGPPTGVVSMSKMRSELGVLRTDPKGIIMGQAAYNAVTSARLHRLHDWLVRIEMAAFAFLLLFLAVYAICDLLHLHVTHVIAGPLVVASAVVPTVCAACLALDAKLGIEENYLRSKKLAAEFAVLDERIASVSSIPEGIELVRDAGRLLLSDVDAWQDAAVRRKIVAL